MVDTITDTIYTVSSPDFELKAGRHRRGDFDKYKYLGGALSLCGKYAYLFPCGTYMNVSEIEVIYNSFYFVRFR